MHKNNEEHHTKIILKELQLNKAKNIANIQPLLCGGWSKPDNIYDRMDACFHVDRGFHCIPYILPLRANTYYSEELSNVLLTAELLTKTTWTGTTISLPEL
jgi:hypothetical protein